MIDDHSGMTDHALHMLHLQPTKKTNNLKKAFDSNLKTIGI